MIRKLGQFFFIIGTIFTIVFFASTTHGEINFNFCFGSVIFLAAALLLRKISQDKDPKLKHFRLLRKLLDKDQEE